MRRSSCSACTGSNSALKTSLAVLVSLSKACSATAVSSKSHPILGAVCFALGEGHDADIALARGTVMQGHLAVLCPGSCALGHSGCWQNGQIQINCSPEKEQNSLPPNALKSIWRLWNKLFSEEQALFKFYRNMQGIPLGLGHTIQTYKRIALTASHALSTQYLLFTFIPG